ELLGVRVAGLDPVLRPFMGTVRVGEGPDDGHSIREPGQARKEATEAHAGMGGRHRIEGAAEFPRRVRLGVEGFELRGTAVEEEENDGGSTRRLRARGCGGTGPEQLGQGQAPGESEAADGEEIAATAAVALAAQGAGREKG